MQITTQDKDAIREIEGKPGFRVIQHLCREFIKDLDSVRDIHTTSADKAGIQALGRQYAVKAVGKFLSDLQIIEKPLTKKDNTYE